MNGQKNRINLMNAFASFVMFGQRKGEHLRFCKAVLATVRTEAVFAVYFKDAACKRTLDAS